MRLNEKGQCPCRGRKPLLYKRWWERGSPYPGQHPAYVCLGCLRAYDVESKEQIENDNWCKNENGEFVERPERVINTSSPLTVRVTRLD